MISRPAYASAVMIVLIAAANAFVASRNGPEESSVTGCILVGLMWGSILGQIILSAAWVLLGPHSRKVRTSLAILWLLTVIAAFGVAFYRTNGLSELERVTSLGIIALSAVGLWLLIQFHLFILYLITGLHVEDAGLSESTSEIKNNTSIVQKVVAFATVTGLLLAGIKGSIVFLLEGRGDVELQDVAFVVLSASLMMLPLLLASLISPRLSVAFVIAMVVVVGATMMEVFSMKDGAGRITIENTLSVAATNGVASLWMLIAASLLQWSGYRLNIPQ